MKGRQLNPAFFRKEQTGKPSSSVATKLRNARSKGTLNFSSSNPPLIELPIESFNLDQFIEEGEKFWETEPLRSLDASFNKITYIPDDVGNLVDCQMMKFKDNLIESLPDSLFEGCISLRSLNVEKNRIRRLNDNVSGLVNIKELLLGENDFTELPLALFQLSSLTKLEAQTNKIQSLPSNSNVIWNLPFLTILNVSENKLRCLPESVSALRALEVLNCSRNNISILPDLSNLSSLKFLDASQNAISSFPALPSSSSSSSSSSPPCLTHLVLSYNRLKEIDMNALGGQLALCELLCPNNAIQVIPDTIEFLSILKILDISNNDVRDLPCTLGWMTSLQKLKVDGNAIKSIRQSLLLQGSPNELKKYLRSRGPSLLGQDTYSDVPTKAATSAALRGGEKHGISNRSGAPSATMSEKEVQISFRVRDINNAVLDFSKLGLSTLPDSLTDDLLAVPSGPSIASINLSNNNFKSLPFSAQFMEEFSSFVTLNMSGNKLNEATDRDFDTGASFFSPLKSLDISKNKLSAPFVDGFIMNMNLSSLEMSNNPLLTIPRSVNLQSDLRVLRMSYCSLTSADSLDFSVMPGLEVLDISNNKIDLLPLSVTIARRLEYLSVENNNIREIPLELCQLVTLRTLLLAGNPQRTVRSNVVQQGSAKILEYLRNKCGTTAPLLVAAPTTSDHQAQHVASLRGVALAANDDDDDDDDDAHALSGGHDAYGRGRRSSTGSRTQYGAGTNNPSSASHLSPSSLRNYVNNSQENSLGYQTASGRAALVSVAHSYAMTQEHSQQSVTTTGRSQYTQYQPKHHNQQQQQEYQNQQKSAALQSQYDRSTVFRGGVQQQYNDGGASTGSRGDGGARNPESFNANVNSTNAYVMNNSNNRRGAAARNNANTRPW